MILVDSCVWIDLLRGKKTAAVVRLRQIQQEQSPEICINSIIFFEVLRGISSDFERRKVQMAFELLESREPLYENFQGLVELDIFAQKKGIRINKLGDWLILKTVLDHGLSLLTSDHDFFRLKKVFSFPLDVPA